MARRIALCTRDLTLAGEVTAYLERAGYQVQRVTGPEEVPVAGPAADLLVVDEETAHSLWEPLQQVIRQRPAIYLQSSRDARRTCWALRDGYRECLLMPEDLPLLADAITRCAARPVPVPQQEEPQRGHIVAVFSGSGGAGRTVVSAHLAAALASSGLLTLAADLNLQLGALRQVFSHDGTGSLVSLLPVLEELNETHLRNAVDSLTHRLDLLAAPTTYMPQLLAEEEVRRLLDVCNRHYEVVVTDLPAGVTPITRAVLQLATDIVYLLEPTAAGLWALGATLGQMEQAELPRERLKVVLNYRSPYLVSLAEHDVHRLYGLPTMGRFHFDPGAPLCPILKTWANPASASGLAKQVGHLGGRLVPTSPTQAAAATRGRAGSRPFRLAGRAAREG